MKTSDSAPGQRGALVFFIIMLAAYLAATIVFAVQAPDRVPSHFNAAGHADDWSSKVETLVTMSLIGVVLPLLLAIRWPWGRWPAVLNVPHKDYWISHERRSALTGRMVTFMRLLAGAMCALMGAILVVMLVDSRSVGTGQTTPGWVFPVMTAAFLAAIALCVVKLYRDLKPPDPQVDAEPRYTRGWREVD